MRRRDFIVGFAGIAQALWSPTTHAADQAAGKVYKVGILNAGVINAAIRVAIEDGIVRYGAIIKAAGWPDQKGTVVLVGHQPDLGHAAAFLVSGEQTEVSIKKGGLWWLSDRVRGEEAQVVVRAVVSPDLL